MLAQIQQFPYTQHSRKTLFVQRVCRNTCRPHQWKLTWCRPHPLYEIVLAHFSWNVERFDIRQDRREDCNRFLVRIPKKMQNNSAVRNAVGMKCLLPLHASLLEARTLRKHNGLHSPRTLWPNSLDCRQIYDLFEFASEYVVLTFLALNGRWRLAPRCGLSSYEY